MAVSNPAPAPAGMPALIVPVVVLWFATSLFALWQLKPADPAPRAGDVCRGAVVAAPATPVTSKTP